MRHTGLEPLSAELEGLLAEERRFLPESAELRARAMTRARGAHREAHRAPARSLWRRRVPLLVAAALGTAFATVAIAAWQDERQPSSHHPGVAPPASVANDARARALEPVVPDVEPTSSNSTSEVAPEPPDHERGAALPVRRSPASGGGDSDALELGLLQRARAAVLSHKFSSALDAIAEHQQRFPAGRFQEEREALRVKALAGLGRNDEARIAAERFRERFPRSVLSTRIENTIRRDP
jgi:hypothetical protein